ncbi:hypothetical protein FRB94_009220 [Tulasnella sp. JGI-2019a]|nr:hypothetical protein FRB93_008349 [Tulasnella sp. JGI-2019a]KAG8995358.1 hypothetical protein FRB94_009220 [Tulasnella sp. JGI-2019a]KAG9026597.1 hypothetical protein FRB95_008684 [Tulasnella sp. JGI-2019a]
MAAKRPEEAGLAPKDATLEVLDSLSVAAQALGSTPSPSTAGPSQPGEEALNTIPALEPQSGVPLSQDVPSPKPSGWEPLTAPQSKDYLIEKARQFLVSPEIRYQDDEKKRFFLLNKGLDPGDVEMLLEENALPPPPLPPRTYPGATKRTDWLALLASVSKALVYLSGASVAVLFVYYRILLPRISAALEARHLLQAQGADHLKGMQDRVRSLKESLPPIVWPEPNGKDSAIEPSRTAVDSMPLSSETELDQVKAEANDASGPPKSKTNDLAKNLFSLAESIQSIRFARQINRDQSDTLQSMTNLTGFISSRIHYRSYQDVLGAGAAGTKRSTLGPVEDEVRSEIRALKGLALNRRTFVSATPLAPAVSPAR